LDRLGKKIDKNPHNPHKRELPDPPPQLLPQCPPTLLTFREARSIVRGLLRHKARPPRRALWYFNIRLPQCGQRIRPANMRSWRACAVSPDDRDDAVAAQTLVTQNARPLKNFDNGRRVRRAPAAFHAKRCEELPRTHGSENRRDPMFETALLHITKAKHRLDQGPPVETG